MSDTGVQNADQGPQFIPEETMINYLFNIEMQVQVQSRGELTEAGLERKVKAAIREMLEDCRKKKSPGVLSEKETIELLFQHSESVDDWETEE